MYNKECSGNQPEHSDNEKNQKTTDEQSLYIFQLGGLALNFFL